MNIARLAAQQAAAAAEPVDVDVDQVDQVPEPAPAPWRIAPKTYSRTPVAVMCLHCAEACEDHPDGRPRRYCSERCRVAAFRVRSKAKSAG